MLRLAVWARGGEAVRYVRAENAARALRLVAGELYEVDVASTDDVVAAVQAGTFQLLEPSADGGTGRPGGTCRPGVGAAGELAGDVLLSEVLALRALFLNLRPLPGHALPGEAEVLAEIARADATKMQRARERLAAQKKASEAAR